LLFLGRLKSLRAAVLKTLAKTISENQTSARWVIGILVVGILGWAAYHDGFQWAPALKQQPQQGVTIRRNVEHHTRDAMLRMADAMEAVGARSGKQQLNAYQSLTRHSHADALRLEASKPQPDNNIIIAMELIIERGKSSEGTTESDFGNLMQAIQMARTK
jgi:hypothetical protein